MSVQALALFWPWLQNRGRTDSTCKKYAETLTPFLAWIGGRALDDLKYRDIEAYLNQWTNAYSQRRGRRPSPAGRKNQITALKTFFDFATRMEYVDKNPMLNVESPKLVRNPIKHLTEQEDREFMGAAKTPQERIVTILLRYTGLRWEEAQLLTWADLDEEAGTLTVTKSKTPSGRRTIPIFPELACEIPRWRRHQRGLGVYGENLTVLATKTGTPMHHQHAFKLIKRVAWSAGVRRRNDPRGINISDVSAHWLRRQFGTWLLNKGKRVEAIAAVLGHSSPTITMQSYAAFDRDKLMAELLV